MTQVDTTNPDPQPTAHPPRIRPIVWVVGVLLVGGGCCLIWYLAAGASAPDASLNARDFNLLLITMDTTRADFIGCYGNKTARTPVLDRLAREGTLFSNCTTCVSLTGPSHASIMTGLYPFVHGVRNNGSERLATSLTTLAEALKDAGYATGAEIASAVLDDKFGLNQGFDTYQDVPWGRDLKRRPAGYPERRGDDVCDAALGQLRNLADRKFFLWVHFYDPHDPYAPPGFPEGDPREGYAAEIAFMDTQIGRLTDELTRLGIDRKTIVALVGDHGEGLHDHGEIGHGYLVYNTTLRIPFILWGPGVLPERRLIEAQVRTIDILPTVLQLLDVPLADATVQGANLLPPISAGNESELDLPAYGESIYGYLRFRMSPLRSLTRGSWKFVLGPQSDLYDLSSDPYEQHNLIDQYPDRATEMRDELRALIAEAPPPPSSEDLAVTLTPEEQARLASLGYAAGTGSPTGDEGPTELDIFEPKGDDPRTAQRILTLDSAAMEAREQKDWPAAEHLLRELATLLPAAPAPKADLGAVFWEQHRYAEACDAFRQAIELDPQNDTTRIHLVEVLLLAERWDEAIEHLVQLPPTDAEVAGNMGLALLGLGRFDDAKAEFERVLTIDPTDAKAAQGIGRVLARQGKLAEAEAWLRDAAARFPDSSDVLTELAALLQKQERNVEAADLYRRAVEIDPKNTDAFSSLGVLLTRGENWQSMLDQSTRTLEQQPDNPEALYYKGMAAVKLGRVDEGIAAFEQANRASPGDVRVVRGLGLALLQANRVSEADATFRDAADRHPEVPAILGDLAYVRQTQGRFEEACRLYEDALAALPDDGNVRAMYGALLMQMQRWDEALRHLIRASELLPSDFRVWFNRATVEAQLLQLDQARAHFDEALKLSPGNPAVLHALGVVCVKQNQIQDAAAYFRKAVAADPNNRAAQSDLQRVLDMLKEQPQSSTQPAPVGDAS